ncbi:hypothetical protein HanRHA438_Chr01g0012371 [Helianthus annuus]|nr:hypothetical protein HanRHA438_Chr01g0012371 [Helianthus annuus]
MVVVAAGDRRVDGDGKWERGEKDRECFYYLKMIGYLSYFAHLVPKMQST